MQGKIFRQTEPKPSYLGLLWCKRFWTETDSMVAENDDGSWNDDGRWDETRKIYGDGRQIVSKVHCQVDSWSPCIEG